MVRARPVPSDDRALAAEEDRFPHRHVHRACAQLEARGEQATNQRFLHPDSRASRPEVSPRTRVKGWFAGLTRVMVQLRRVRFAPEHQKRHACEAGNSRTLMMMSSESRISVLALQDDDSGLCAHRVQNRAIDADDRAKTSPRADEASLPRDAQVVDQKRPLIGDLDRALGLVESHPQCGNNGGFADAGNPPNLDERALDPREGSAPEPTRASRS